MLNFERIELFGFKSFADKVKIELLDGITAIVGPNGCGKSNVADAIKWVLGEQSAKTLRGSSMQDVIFNGTQARKSLSYCEVSLVFNNVDGENTTKLFPNLEYSEVVFTRKLFRSGDSEYYINRQPCRMKDIIDALHECGVSKDGYTIISQGKVSEILSSKPEDRRSIFEEAVGIAKTKRDRKETINKLNRTNDNIMRVDDILTERQRPLESLRKQSEATRAFRSFSEQLKHHEVNAYIYKYENASGARKKIQDKIQGLDEQLQLRRKELEETIHNYDFNQREINGVDNEMKELNDKILESSVAMEKQSGDAKLFNEKISFFRSNNERSLSAINNGNNKISDNEKAVAKKKKYSVYLNKEIDELNSKAQILSKKINDLSMEINSGEDAAQSAQNDVIKSVESLVDIKKNLASLTSEKSLISEQQKGILEKVNGLVDRYEALNTDKQNKVKELEEVKKEYSKAQEEIKDKTQDISATNEFISKITNNITEVNTRLIRNEAQLKAKQDVKNSLDGYNYAVKSIIKASRDNLEISKRFKGTVASVISTDKKYENAINTSIGGAMQNVITDSDVDAKYLIEFLKRNSLGRATFLPVKTIKTRINGNEIKLALRERGAVGLATDLVKYDVYYENIVSYLLGGTLIVENMDSAISISHKFPYSFKIVTLDGDLISQTGSLTGGAVDGNSKVNLLAVDRVIADYTEAVAKDKAELERLTSSRLRFTTQINAQTEELNELKQKCTDLKQAEVKLNEQIESLNNFLVSVEKDIDANKDEIAVITARLDQIQTEYTGYAEGDEKLQKEKQDASNKQQENREKFSELRKQRDDMLAENTEVLSKISSLRAEISSTENDVQRILDENEEIKAQNVHESELIEKNEQIIKSLLLEVEKVALSKEDQEKLNAMREKLKMSDERKAKLNALSDEYNLRRGALQEDIDKLTSKRAQEDIEYAKIDSDLEYMSQNLFEEYQLTYETCLSLRDENYDISMSRQDIATLKRKISQLGAVNPNAIEEYAEQAKEYEELLAQRDDLVKAQEDLQHVISDLTKEMTLTFDEGFKTIKSNFTKIFKELFGGGTADLVVEESLTGDPLDAGIEIVAEPPGKKLQKISLLSGGEMSLTAIAILFSILRLRPMPFCVLDEIEAALDDANVQRFANYLKNFSKETQFICITHKKVTMENSDGLFGVTMPEKGVSSIVSVKLSDMNEKGELKN